MSTVLLGSCHCGAVQFDVEMELENLATCNCSICGKTGTIMAFVPASQLSGSGRNMKRTLSRFFINSPITVAMVLHP